MIVLANVGFFVWALVLSSIGSHHYLQATLPEPLKKEPIAGSFGDNIIQFSSRLRIEGFFGKNTEYLNNANGGLDQTIIPARHTIDLVMNYSYGHDKYGYDLVKIKTTIRNKGNWGNPDSIASTDRALVKFAGVSTGDHFHALNRHYVWIREMWIESAINDMFQLNFCNTHTITAGFFPFELGRGIALGEAYAVDPDFLGFYSPNAVDQYAPGCKLSGSLDVDEHITYDLYAALLTNRSDNLTNTRAPILAQEYERQFSPQRGFGILNWLCAGRIQIHAYQGGDNDDVVFEPYALFLDQREQRIEFLGDAETKLGTAGLAIDATVGALECGFEFAQNLGRQRVKGWDRNVTTVALRNGTLVEENTQVAAVATISPDVAGSNALVTPATQGIINLSIRSQAQNGQIIGSTNLQNSDIRFRDAYVNTFDGYMAIWDMRYTFNSGLKIAATAGLATGDVNPNRDQNAFNDSQMDSVYSGFISIQEQYAGKRVQSAFLMSGAGRVPRIISFPSRRLNNAYPDKTSQFTNLMFTGIGVYADVGAWHLNSNIISYWQEKPARIFPVAVSPTDERLASTWLGIEYNLFADVCLDNAIKLYGVTSVFVPGSHYSDLQGIPLSSAQQKYMNALNSVANTAERVPLLGTNAAFTLNVGIEYKF